MNYKERAELMKELCEICETLNMAKAILDKTGEAPLPYETYSELNKRREEISTILRSKK